MADPRDSFELGLQRDEPPASATPLLLALWHRLRGDWIAAHEIAQTKEDDDGAWVHAWLHRVEGDRSNAAYWYRRAGRPAADGDTHQDGLLIARALLGGVADEQSDLGVRSLTSALQREESLGTGGRTHAPPHKADVPLDHQR